ncbi:MAG TPA: hypothetical protein VGK29_04335 [Paludibaculum sp.]
MSPNPSAIDSTDLIDEALGVWRACPLAPPCLPRRFDETRQAEGERQMTRFLGGLQAELRSIPRTRTERQGVHQRITAAFAAFGRDGLGLDDAQMALLLHGGLSSIGTAMARQARLFDAAVSLPDVLQASRNAWTACGLQMLFGRPMCLTPSIFAYSMLYPYSDNYMDDPGVGAADKRGFSRRFALRLAGAAVEASNEREADIWRLVGLIEGEYQRCEHSAVYASLAMIQHAQEQSLLLMRNGAPPGVDVARLSFAKGGTSVLADAYLAAGQPTSAQARFAFHWGILLQLADDLQDVEEDRQAGVRTVFTQAAEHGTLDQCTSRTLFFAQWVMRLLDDLPGADHGALIGLIRRSSLSLIVRSVGEAGGLYSPEYLAAMESQSPFRFAFLNHSRQQFEERSGLLIQLFEAFLAGEPDEPAFPWLPSSLMPR